VFGLALMEALFIGHDGRDYLSLLKDIAMRKKFSIALTLLALIGAAPLLSACHTTAGVGQDLTAGGKAITNTADKHTP
jgi:predicted small secreted protein